MSSDVLAPLHWYAVVMPEGSAAHAALEAVLSPKDLARGLIRGGGLVAYSISMHERDADRFIVKLNAHDVAEGGDFALCKGDGGAFEPVPAWLEQLTVVDGAWVALTRDNLDAGPLRGYRVKTS